MGKTEDSGKSAQAPMVQKTTGSAPSPSAPSSAPSKSDAWRWSRKKRKAVRLVVKGFTDTKISEDLGVHRNTIRRWKEVQEFQAAVITEATAYTQRTRFKRVYEVGVFADTYGNQLAKTMSRVNKQKDGPTQIQLNALQALTRGYSEMRNHERQDFGDNVQRVNGHFTVGAVGTVDPTAQAAGAQSFKRFIEDNVDKIPKGIIGGARNSGEALILATRSLVQNTDVLDKLYEEDKAAFDKEKADK